MSGGPDPAVTAQIKQSVAGAQPGTQAQAAVPAGAVPAASSSAPPRAPGIWQIQVGAFRNSFAAEAHLRALERELPQLAQLSRSHQLRGTINRVRIGGIADEAAARELCAGIAAVGRGCFVAGPES